MKIVTIILILKITGEKTMKSFFILAALLLSFTSFASEAESIITKNSSPIVEGKLRANNQTINELIQKIKDRLTQINPRSEIA